MVNVKFFGAARAKYGKKECCFSASNVKHLILQIANEFGVEPKEFKQFLVYVNEVDIRALKKYRTKLSSGDSVMFFSPSSGG